MHRWRWLWVSAPKNTLQIPYVPYMSSSFLSACHALGIPYLELNFQSHVGPVHKRTVAHRETEFSPPVPFVWPEIAPWKHCLPQSVVKFKCSSSLNTSFLRRANRSFPELFWSENSAGGKGLSFLSQTELDPCTFGNEVPSMKVPRSTGPRGPMGNTRTS